MLRKNNYRIILLIAAMVTASFSFSKGEAVQDSNAVELSGTVTYNGKPMSDITDIEPAFSCRYTNTGELTSASLVEYDNYMGYFSADNIPLSNVTLHFGYHLYGQRPTLPGNYMGDLQVYVDKLSEDEAYNLDVPMKQVIHMISPQDNNAVEPSVGRGTDVIYEHEGDVYFEWEPLDGAVNYDLKIDIYQDADENSSYKFLTNELTATAIENSYLAQLPLSEQGEHYEARLDAYNKAGDKIGMYVVTYKNGYGYDYRFKVIVDD